jgi:hypothetical protein
MAQLSEAKARENVEILKKIRSLDLLNQILPLLLTKDQIKRLLPAMERMRAAVRETEDLQSKYLKQLQPKIDAALKDAYEKGLVVDRKLAAEAWATMTMLQVKVKAVADDNVEQLTAVFEDVLEPTQEKIAANALEPKLIDPTLDKSKMTDRDKLKLYVRAVLSDALTYDILIKLSQKP